MNKKLEYFNATIVNDCESMQPIIDALPNNIYFLGHRLEDGLCIESLAKCIDFTISEQYKDCFVGKVSRDKFEIIANFLRDNFISGYILWFVSNVDYSLFDFGELFIGSKKIGLLTLIYQAKHSSILSYDINVPNELKGKVKGMVFTDSGESDFMFLKPYRPS